MQDSVNKGLQEACGERALLYRIVARWIKAFKEGRNVTDMPQPCHPAVREDVQTMNALVLVDLNTMIRELANDAGLAPSTMLNTLKKQLGIQKITSRCVQYDLTERQKWLRYDAACTHYECKGEAFLRRIITIDETWARAYNHS